MQLSSFAQLWLATQSLGFSFASNPRFVLSFRPFLRLLSLFSSLEGIVHSERKRLSPEALAARRKAQAANKALRKKLGINPKAKVSSAGFTELIAVGFRVESLIAIPCECLPARSCFSLRFPECRLKVFSFVLCSGLGVASGVPQR